MNNLPEELRFVVEDSIVNGTGVGMPKGILAGAGPRVSVAKETGQAATTIVSQNVIKMWARMYAPNRRNAVWLINQDCEPQLLQMSIAVGTGGQLVYTPPGGLSGAPYGTIFGRPVLPVEYCQTLGTQGDIVLTDLSDYQMIEKGGIQSASSIHVNFTTDESVFRFVYRCDGQPKQAAALIPFKGTNTLAPTVILDTRS
jgi:HK97 family phage major capsid protein